jgi:hypothetical protein
MYNETVCLYEVISDEMSPSGNQVLLQDYKDDSSRHSGHFLSTDSKGNLQNLGRNDSLSLAGLRNVGIINFTCSGIPNPFLGSFFLFLWKWGETESTWYVGH